MHLKKLFWSLNIFVPLIIGLAVYIFFKRGTYINSLISLNMGEVPSCFVIQIIIYWGCDFLWAYSLVFTLYRGLYSLKNGLIYSALSAVLCGIFFELFQYAGYINGTFDFFDIFAEITAVIIAVVIIKKSPVVIRQDRSGKKIK